MASSRIDEARIDVLNDTTPSEGSYVLYWMQAAVRARDNHALEHAVQTANDLDRPLVVGFGLDPDYPEATPRAFRFLVDGLVAVASGLERRNIPFVVRLGAPLEVAAELAGDACAVVCDRAHLREPRSWRSHLAQRFDGPLDVVETNLVVPVDTVSDKREWAARTLRPKIHEHLDRFLTELATTPLDRTDPPELDSLDAGDRASLLENLGVDDIDDRFRGGEHQAHATLRSFVDEGLDGYADAGTVVDGDRSSHLSMYLHYGHISPVAIARAVSSSGADQTSIDDFLEELVVRRELAHNFVWYEPDYDSYTALPDWARTTLGEHRDDPREEVYTADEMARAETDDVAWNAAMTEMRETGYLHNRMRMYWGKQIMRWTNTPEYGYRVTLELNNRYLLDGRDANSYANVGWVYGLHDQAFAEREVIGKVRPMTRSGLDRKIDVDAYVAFVEESTGVQLR